MGQKLAAAPIGPGSSTSQAEGPSAVNPAISHSRPSRKRGVDRKGALFLPPSLLPGRENRHVWAWILCSSLTRHFRKGSLCVPRNQSVRQ